MKRSTIVTTIFLVLALLVAAIPALAQQAQNYVVQPGDTLASVAQKFNVPLATLAQANNIVNYNLIYVGTTLFIPAANTGGTGSPAAGGTIRYIVKKGDTLSQIAVNYNTSVQAIKNANGFSTSVIYPNQGLWIPVGVYVPPVYTPPTYPSGQYYYVKPGDNLFAIGMKYGVNIYRIAEANGILNLNRIYAGLPLFIPR